MSSKFENTPIKINFKFFRQNWFLIFEVGFRKNNLDRGGSTIKFIVIALYCNKLERLRKHGPGSS